MTEPVAVKTTKYASWWFNNVENKSQMADGRHLEKTKYHHVTVVV